MKIRRETIKRFFEISTVVFFFLILGVVSAAKTCEDKSYIVPFAILGFVGFAVSAIAVLWLDR